MALPHKSMARVRADFDRIALWSQDRSPRLDPYERELLADAPRRMERAFELGCGLGAFARALAERARRVEAMDLSPGMIEKARQLSAYYSNIDFFVGDATRVEIPSRTYDCVASIATLHHLPLRPMLRRLSAALRPGGVLLILDLDDSRGLRNLPRNLLASIASRLAWRTPSSRELARAWHDHCSGETYPRFDEVRQVATELLPGAHVTRRLRWRYSIVWTKER